jgi:hypothetical protein
VRQAVENYPKRKYPTLTAAQWLLERLAAAQLDSARPNLDEHVLSRAGAESSRAVTALPGTAQSNQIGEIAAVIIAINATAPYQPLKIITDSKYVIDGLTTYLHTWEDDGWIGIKNAPFFKKSAHLL